MNIRECQTHPQIFDTSEKFRQERHVAASAVQNEAAKVVRGKAGKLGQMLPQSYLITFRCHQTWRAEKYTMKIGHVPNKTSILMDFLLPRFITGGYGL